MSESSSTQPYSDRVRDMATVETSIAISHEPTIGDLNPIGCDRVARAILDAAHDRGELGLDASVCARTVHEWIEDNCGDEMADQFEYRFSGLPSER